MERERPAVKLTRIVACMRLVACPMYPFFYILREMPRELTSHFPARILTKMAFLTRLT
jgi:hypothetical protein